MIQIDTKADLANEIDRVQAALKKSNSPKLTRDLKKYLTKLQMMYRKYRWDE